MFLFTIRHHTNPVGTEWKWKMDEPKMIVDGALENHYKMVKQFRGKICKITSLVLYMHYIFILLYQSIYYFEANPLILKERFM